MINWNLSKNLFQKRAVFFEKSRDFEDQAKYTKLDQRA